MILHKLFGFQDNSTSYQFIYELLLCARFLICRCKHSKTFEISRRSKLSYVTSDSSPLQTWNVGPDANHGSEHCMFTRDLRL